jgi:hypothetical protein
MPRVNRKGKRKTAQFDAMDIEFLRRGPHGVPCILTEADDSGDESTIRAAWGELRSTILPQWISERPGSRCWAWWKFDSPPGSRRERIDGKVHPHDCRERTLHVAASDNKDLWQRAYALHWGMPAIHLMPWDEDLTRDFMTNQLRGRESVIWEPEWSFLQRHNLLLREDSP